eukprot:TRINITY_DN10434_c0_g1_i1.p1 TRINITY_DN10434_c0_g1~~TRINITY_DN10434_c0_g1_i1.p1  ORF type:complete len:253 (+),score=57.35 TRINITY_DN10434_c0_g1_i1:93-851(+)
MLRSFPFGFVIAPMLVVLPTLLASLPLAVASESGENASYEWFLESEEFVKLVRPYLQLHHHVLQIGCGNSRVAEVMADTGFTDVTSVDVSPSVIEANKAKYEGNPALKFVVGDVFAMKDFKTNTFDAALDKGTWDAIAKKKSKDMLKEVRRVLKKSAVYLVLTFSKPENALDYLLDWRVNWKVEYFVKTPNPFHKGEGDSLTHFYLYVCRNEDREKNWVPAKGAGEEVDQAIRKALDYQQVEKIFSSEHSEL